MDVLVDIIIIFGSTFVFICTVLSLLAQAASFYEHDQFDSRKEFWRSVIIPYYRLLKIVIEVFKEKAEEINTHFKEMDECSKKIDEHFKKMKKHSNIE